MIPVDPGKLEPLSELVNIGIGKAAEVLNAMLGSHVQLSVPAIRVIDPDELVDGKIFQRKELLSAVEMDFAGDISGRTALVFASPDAGKLVDCITSTVSIEGEDLDSIRAGTLCEVGNIIINAVLGTIANIVSFSLSYSVPIYLHSESAELAEGLASGKGVVILITTRFRVESLEVDGDIVLFFSLLAMENLQAALERFVHG